MWRAVDRIRTPKGSAKLNKTIGWHLGNRSVKTLQPFFRKFKDLKNTVFYTDNWEAYKKVIPKKSANYRQKRNNWN